MTAKQADKLIPWVSCNLIGNADELQTMLQVRTEVMAAVGDMNNKWQMRHFAAQWKGKTVLEQVKLLYSLHGFIRANIRYIPDGVKSQIIQDPACTWRHRRVGTDCKSLTVFSDAIAYWLRIPVLITWLLYPGDYGHVYPTFIIGGQRLIFDVTYHQLNRSPVASNLIQKFELYARN